ncbi:MAG: pyridine nucleotide-disulfide oxidoreductase [Deltaproteobacteria bacterium]|nr:pyridine nucleotide-disulfide oxidoreductase [Deltaproteobacteria bacterium]
MGKHLVLVGGGHAHLTCLKELKVFIERGHEVTLIGPASHHYYSGMGPGMLGGTYRPQEIRFNILKMAQAAGARFLQGVVVEVRPGEKRLVLASGEEVPYDVVSFNTGSGIPTHDLPIAPDANVFTVKPIEQLLKAQKFIRDRLTKKMHHILLAGGGPAGLEITGNLVRLASDLGGRAEITLVAGRRLMGDFPDKVRSLALASLTERGVKVIEGTRLREVQTNVAVLQDGRMLPFDMIFLALGVRPSPLFNDSGLPTGPDGGLLVNEFLQSVAHPEIFGGGDCIYFQPQPLDKVGVYAVRQNPILLHNLQAALENRVMWRFKPQGAYLLIFNLGNGRAIFRRKQLVFDGPLAFKLKDYIDRRFMQKFQISGELEEA